MGERFLHVQLNRNSGSALFAVWWFFFRADYRKKLAFNVRCLAFRHPDNAKEKFIELMFELANNGQRENRIYTLAV